MNMGKIDDFLGPRIHHVIDDGEGGEWEISLRPRKAGRPVVRTTAVSFHRPGSRSASGFGVQVWVLRMQVARPQELRDPVVDCSINLTQTAARNALAWIDTLGERGGAAR